MILLKYDVLSFDELVNWDHTPPDVLPWVAKSASSALFKLVKQHALSPRSLFLPSRGQMLLLADAEGPGSKVIQIMGWTTTGGWQTRQWTMDRKKRPSQADLLGRTLTDDPDATPLLAGSSLRYSTSELTARVTGRIFTLTLPCESAEHNYSTSIVGFNPSFRFARALTSVARPVCDRPGRYYGNAPTASVEVAPDCRPDQATLLPPLWVQNIIDELQRRETHITVMVSDASARRQPGPISSIFALQPTPYDVETVVVMADAYLATLIG
jgi:hypothetical protein